MGNDVKILITGSLGFIGTNLTKFLLNLGYTVIGVDNMSCESNNYSENIKFIGKHDSFKFYDTNINDFVIISNVFKIEKPDVVIHLAGKSGVIGGELDHKGYYKTNVIGFNNIIELSYKYNIKHLIYSSSSCVYGNSYDKKENCKDLEQLSYYGYTKYMNEKTAQIHQKSHKFPIKITGLRIFNVYGLLPGNNNIINLFINKLIPNKQIVIRGKWKHKLDLIHVDDVLVLINNIIKSETVYKYEIFNVGSGKTKLIYFIYKKLKQKYNKTHNKIIFDESLGVETIKTKANITKVKKYFNWKPKIKIKNFIKTL